MGGIFSNGAAKAARQQQIKQDTAEAQREMNITGGTNAINNTFGQFDDNFFNKQAQDYIGYAAPQAQAQDQFGNAKKQLTFSLDRAGMLDSSTRAQQEADLQKQYDTAIRGINDQGNSYANQSRANVESARSNLLATLNNTGNAQAAANSAIGQASSLSQPAAYSPLGDLFSNITSAAATQAQLERNAALFPGVGGGRYNTGLFNTAGSTKVTA